MPRAPAELREVFGRVVIWSLLAFHAAHEVRKDIVDSFHVIAAFAKIGTAAFPTETHQRDTTFYPQPGCFESGNAFAYARPRGNRVLDHDHRFIELDSSFNQLLRTVGLAVLADQEAVIAAS